MKSKRILVTGGAGYIGSHAVLKLVERGYEAVVLDDLSTGVADAVLDAELIIGDVGDSELLMNILGERDFDAVMHFAAKTVVPESVANPLRYYLQNTANTRTLIECCVDSGVEKLVFSSTAAVYGLPDDGVASEDTPTNPINPYGSSKLMSEWMLRDVAAAGLLRYVTLRYFNVAGCDPEGRIGQSKADCTLLTKVACEAALGRREALTIYGEDYPTPDGTGVRDYIHVDDIAMAHLAALDYLDDNGKPITLNCGYGHGYSVREVISALEEVHGSTIPVARAGRRAGDPAILVANSEKIRQVLGWYPHYDDLAFILRTALTWEYQLQRKMPEAGNLAAIPAARNRPTLHASR